MAYKDKVYGPHCEQDHDLGFLGMLAVLAGEAISSYALASVLMALVARRASIFGRYKWKAVLIVLGLIWIPVPETVAFVYQITVVF